MLVVGGWYYSKYWYGPVGPRPADTRVVRHDIEEVKIGNREIRYVTGPRYEAIDGDSLRSGGEDIRILGIDAPELYQTCGSAAGGEWACGREAHNQLRTLVAGGVQCVQNGRDRYGRTLGRCSAGPVADVGEVMVREGLAIAYLEGSYEAAEREARAARRGIWAGTFEQPAEYRRQNPRRAAR